MSVVSEMKINTTIKRETIKKLHRIFHRFVRIHRFAKRCGHQIGNEYIEIAQYTMRDEYEDVTPGQLTQKEERE